MSKISFPIIIDDIVDKNTQDRIEDSMFDCKWDFYCDITLGSKTKDNPLRKILNPYEYQVSPAIISNLIYQKTVFDIFLPVLYNSTNSIDFNIFKIERCFAGMHLSMRHEPKVDTVHLNRKDPHLVILYYVIDSDGETILYDKTIDDIPYDIEFPEEYCELSITHKIKPKKGRVLIFNGNTYHASSTPSIKNRCNITTDLFGKFEDDSYIFPVPESSNKKKGLTYE